jgi:hypothetical protein
MYARQRDKIRSLSKPYSSASGYQLSSSVHRSYIVFLKMVTPAREQAVSAERDRTFQPFNRH